MDVTEKRDITTVLGVDPGASGSIALYFGAEPEWIKTDSTERDLWEQVRLWDALYGVAHAFIERVHSMPKQGVSSSFKFGQSYGFLRGLLVASGIPFEEVTPQTWQKAMGCLTRGDKNVSKARAQQLFPGVKITHANADALLIAEYGRRALAARSQAQAPA